MFLALALAEGAAHACSFIGPQPLDIAASDDVTAPTLDVGAVDVKRGTRVGGSSCNDLGWITITALADDDGEGPVGFEVEVVDGALPPGLTGLPEGPQVYDPADALFWVWIDGATNEQEPFSFVVAITAVDAAGNRSAPVEVTVADEGATAAGCATVPAPALPLAAALAALTSRRRPSPARRAQG